MTCCSADGDDRLSGDVGADTMTGGAGADRFSFRPGQGSELNDWVVYV